MISLRASVRHLLWSKPVRVCLVFLIFLIPVALVLWFPGRGGSGDGQLSLLYNIALVAPATGILVALLSLVAAVWRATRPVLRIDDRVHLPRTGVTFPLAELDRIELYVREGSHLALLPRHLGPEVSVRAVPKAVASYTVRFPEEANWQPVELADELRRRVPGLTVHNHGTM